MKIIPLILEYLENSKKITPTELTLIDNYLCDDCYKINSETTLEFPSKCLLTINDFEIKVKEESISILICKASVKSLNVNDYTKYLCLADHAPQVVQSVKKFKYSQIISKINSTESSLQYIPEPAEYTPVPFQIGFGVKPINKNSEFIKKRKIKKILESQDDILSAIIPEKITPKVVFSEPKPLIKESEIIEGDDEFPEFPEWALIYLNYSLKN